MTIIALISIVVSMVLSGVVSYYDTLETVMDSTKAASRYIQSGVEQGEDYLNSIRTADYGTDMQAVRVTIVEADGTVSFDSVADVSEMENHGDRPEIIDALQNGSGESIRESETVNLQSYNYAVQMDDGRILRLSVSMRSVFGSIERMIPWMALCAAVVLYLPGGDPFDLPDEADRRADQQHRPRPSDGERCLRRAFFFSCALSARMKRFREDGGAQPQAARVYGHHRKHAGGFIVVDAKGDVLSYNTSAVRLLGAQDAAEHQHASVLTFNRSHDFRNAVDSALLGTASERVTRIGARSYNLIANPVMGENGVRGAVIVLLDVTEKEESERMRREFTANVSHELKTPLTSISGYAEIMQNGLVRSEDIPRFAGNIYTETQRLITLVEDIIKLSQLDERAVELERTETDLRAIAQDVAERLRVPAKQNRISIRVSGESAKVLGVGRILDEMIFNLADNAVKYNRTGGKVEITTGMQDGHAFVEVADNGIGIPERDRERVFERFYRVDKSRSKQIGGTGLGLSIVKHGAAFHNAHVALQSREGEGTTVRITFLTFAYK